MKKPFVLFTMGWGILFLMYFNQGCDKKNEVNKTESPKSETLESIDNKTASPQSETLESIDNKFALIITGVLVDENNNPMINQNMVIFSGKSETTLNTKIDKNKTVTKIEGTGTIQINIEGIEGGGSIKLVDSMPINPSAETDDSGNFRFEISKEFIEGEEDMIIVRTQPDKSSFANESLPMIDESGNPIRIKIEKKSKVMNLGRIRTLQK